MTMEVAANGEMIAFGNFAGTEKLTIWTKDAAKCTFAEVKLPTTLDPEYTYFVKDMNTGFVEAYGTYPPRAGGRGGVCYVLVHALFKRKFVGDASSLGR